MAMRVLDMSPPTVSLDDATVRALDRAREVRAGAHTARKDVSAMLSQLYDIAGRMLDELEMADLPLEKRLTLAEKAGRLLPILDKAERRARMLAVGKAPEEMTDGELLRALKKSGVFKRLAKKGGA